MQTSLSHRCQFWLFKLLFLFYNFRVSFLNVIIFPANCIKLILIFCKFLKKKYHSLKHTVAVIHISTTEIRHFIFILIQSLLLLVAPNDKKDLISLKIYLKRCVKSAACGINCRHFFSPSYFCTLPNIGCLIDPLPEVWLTGSLTYYNAEK